MKSGIYAHDVFSQRIRMKSKSFTCGCHVESRSAVKLDCYLLSPQPPLNPFSERESRRFFIFLTRVNFFGAECTSTDFSAAPPLSTPRASSQ